MAFTKITQADLNSRGATTLPNQPTISATALKQEFDAPAKNVVAPKVNNLIDELEATSSAASLGAVAPSGRTGNTVQALLNDISSAADAKSTIVLSNVSTSGVRIATVTIDGTATDLKAPQGGQGTMDYGDLTNKPSINSTTLSGNKTSSDLGLAAASHTHTKSDITDFPTLATVATSGSYNDLSNKPSLATVATSGSYSDLSNKPTIPDELSDLSDDSTHRLTTDTEKTAWNAKSTVAWSQNVTTGQKIATVTINGTPTDVYAPTSGGGGGGGAVDSVNGQTGTVVLNVNDINDVTITSASDGQTLAYDSSANKWKNHTVAYSEVSGTPTLATVATSGSYNDLSSKPTIPTVSDNYSSSSTDAMSGVAVNKALQTLDGSITNSPGTGKTLSAFSQTDGVVSATFSDISITKSQVSDFPSLATVATSGSYNDLTNQPTIPDELSDLTGDVSISSPSQNQILQYNGSKWGNAALPVSIAGNGTASSSAVHSQQLTINSSATDIDGTKYMEIASTSSTTYTFTNAAITSTSAIDVYTDTWGDSPSSVTASSGSCTVTFGGAQTRTVRIYIK